MMYKLNWAEFKGSTIKPVYIIEIFPRLYIKSPPGINKVFWSPQTKKAAFVDGIVMYPSWMNCFQMWGADDISKQHILLILIRRPRTPDMWLGAEPLESPPKHVILRPAGGALTVAVTAVTQAVTWNPGWNRPAKTEQSGRTPEEPDRGAMGQEFHIVRCFRCQSFQVQQVRADSVRLTGLACRCFSQAGESVYLLVMEPFSDGSHWRHSERALFITWSHRQWWWTKH